MRSRIQSEQIERRTGWDVTQFANRTKRKHTKLAPESSWKVTNKKAGGADFYFKASTAKCVSLLVQWLCCRWFFVQQAGWNQLVQHFHSFAFSNETAQLTKYNGSGLKAIGLDMHRLPCPVRGELWNTYLAIKTGDLAKTKVVRPNHSTLENQDVFRISCPSDQLQSFASRTQIECTAYDFAMDKCLASAF